METPSRKKIEKKNHGLKKKIMSYNKIKRFIMFIKELLCK